MYKILIKYISNNNGTFWKFYMVDENDTEKEFVTNSTEELETELKKLDMIYGFENIRVILDVTYKLNISMGQIPSDLTITSEDVNDIFNEAYEDIFSGGDLDG